MRLQSKYIASIAILGAVLAVASSEMGDAKYPDVGDIGHQNVNDSSQYSLESTSQRCIDKATIQIDNQDKNKLNHNNTNNNNNNNKTKSNQAVISVSDECKNSTESLGVMEKSNDLISRVKFDWTWMFSSEELAKNDKIRDDRRLKVEDGVSVLENITSRLTTIDSYKPSIDEITNTTAEMLNRSTDEGLNEIIEAQLDTRYDKQQDLSILPSRKFENQLVDFAKIKKPTSYAELITQVRSAKHITFFTTTESPRNSSFHSQTQSTNDTTGLEEGTLESPLVVSLTQILPSSATRITSANEKSEERIIIESKLPHHKKDHSVPSINSLDGKVNKVFYEIKPSSNTAIQYQDNYDEFEKSYGLMITTTRKYFLSGFKIPSLPSSFGKFGPYFLDDKDENNVTERIGTTVQLNCRIGLLGDKKVTWLQHVKDSIRLLTVGNVQYSADERISLKFQYPDNWRLQISYATLRDSGLYKCQVEINPTRSLVKKYNVIITAPLLNITDDTGRVISGERHLKAGSALKLRCEGRDILESLNESLLWIKGDETLTTNVRENRTTKMVADKEISVIVSTLIVERATPRHAGNYSCTVPERAKTTIAVHVLNGELPAAVHHGNGVSRAVLNIWLIHLTVSSGLFR